MSNNRAHHRKVSSRIPEINAKQEWRLDAAPTQPPSSLCTAICCQAGQAPLLNSGSPASCTLLHAVTHRGATTQLALGLRPVCQARNSPTLPEGLYQ